MKKAREKIIIRKQEGSIKGMKSEGKGGRVGTSVQTTMPAATDSGIRGGCQPESYKTVDRDCW